MHHETTEKGGNHGAEDTVVFLRFECDLSIVLVLLGLLVLCLMCVPVITAPILLHARMIWIKSSAGYDGKTAWRALTYLWRVKKGVVSVKKQTGDEVVNLAQLMPIILQDSPVIIPNAANRMVFIV